MSCSWMPIDSELVARYKETRQSPTSWADGRVWWDYSERELLSPLKISVKMRYDWVDTS